MMRMPGTPPVHSHRSGGSHADMRNVELPRRRTRTDPLDAGVSGPGGVTVTEVMGGPLGPALDLGEPAPRLLGRDLDVEDAFDRAAPASVHPAVEDGAEVVADRPLQLVVAAGQRVPIRAPSHELRRVAEPEPSM